MVPRMVQLANGLSFEYVEQGNPPGPAVICLHGYTDSWKSFTPVLPYLHQDIHVFAYSQRGHGNSDRPPEGYQLESFAADLALFMDKMDLDTAIIAGHSMGASVAQRFVLDYPERVKKLLLMGAFSSLIGDEIIAAFHAEVMQLNDPVDPGFIEAFQKTAVARPLSPAFLQTVVSESLKLTAPVLKAILSALKEVDYTKELTAVQQPALLVWGDKDAFTGRENQQHLLQAMTNARLSVYEGTGHSVHWEEPQRFAAELEKFVKESQ